MAAPILSAFGLHAFQSDISGTRMTTVRVDRWSIRRCCPRQDAPICLPHQAPRGLSRDGFSAVTADLKRQSV